MKVRRCHNCVLGVTFNRMWKCSKCDTSNCCHVKCACGLKRDQKRPDTLTRADKPHNKNGKAHPAESATVKRTASKPAAKKHTHK